jgi:8-oxo-dGTP pyrophosphatase MutT (NUDIX family)
MFLALATDPESISRYLLSVPSEHVVVREHGAPELGLTGAAVLVALVQRPEGATVLLTKRTDHLRDHPGQISFPGGRVEPEDVSPEHTALREAQEEIGLDPRLPKILGFLPEYRTGTGFSVTPVVALLNPSFELSLDDFEVAEAFEVPLSFLLNPINHEQHVIDVRGEPRQYYAMRFGSHFIWGATAGMIVSLAQRCGIVPE